LEAFPIFLIVSDCGASLSRKSIPSAFNPLRLKRIIDLIADQNRSLRVRSFIPFVQKSALGAYIQAGAEAKSSIEKLAGEITAAQMSLSENCLSPEEVARAAAYGTNLWKTPARSFGGRSTCCPATDMKPPNGTWNKKPSASSL
jgi:hypothetical protein